MLLKSDIELTIYKGKKDRECKEMRDRYFMSKKLKMYQITENQNNIKEK